MKKRMSFPTLLATVLVLMGTEALAGNFPLRQYEIGGRFPSKVVSICQSSSGGYWFGTEEGLVRCDNYTSSHYRFEPGDNNTIPGNKIYQVIEDFSGNTWVMTDGGIALWNPLANNFKRTGMKAFSALADGRGCYFGATDTLFRVEYSTGDIEVAATFSQGTGFSVNSMFRRQEGEILLFSRESGAFIFKPSSGELEKVGSIQGRSSSLFVDSQGNLWRSVFGRGVECFNREFVRTLFFDTANSGLSCNTVLCFCEYDGNIWMGTDGGGISVYDPSARMFNVLQCPKVTTMSVAEGGPVMAGTAAGGAILVGGMNSSVFARPDDASFLPEIALPDGRELLYKYPDGFFTSDGRPFSFGYGPLETANTQVDQKLSAGAGGSIYIHNDHQLFLFEPYKKAVTEFRIPKEVTGQGPIYQSAGGARGKYFHNSRYIFTPEREATTVRTIFDIGPAKRINGILPGAGDIIWIATTDGLGLYDTVEEKFSFVENDFVKYAGKVLSDGSGNVWIETGAFPVVYNPSENSFFIADDLDTEIIVENEENLILESGTVEVDGKLIPNVAKLKVPVSAERIRLNINVRSAQYHYAVRQFRLLIEGPRGETVVYSDTPSLEFVSPCPGRYRVYGSCSTKNAQWTDFALLASFKVRANWYLNWWLVALVVILAFSGAYAAYKWALRCYTVEDVEKESAPAGERESESSAVAPCSPIDFPLDSSSGE